MPMKYAKVLRTLVIAIILFLVIVLIPAMPALAAPMITLSPTSGSPGTRVTVTGTNFESYRGDSISVFFDDREIDSLVVPDSGIFTVLFDVPDDVVPGRFYVAVRDEEGSLLGSRRPFIVHEVEIELYPRDGAVGTRVTVNGQGFYVGEVVTFYYDGTRADIGTVVAGSAGEFTYTFAIPDSVAGNHEITAEDLLGNSDEANFKVLSSITLDQSSGALGDRVTVSGTGFGYKSDVTIYFDQAEVATDTTGKFGSFEVTFSVPVMQSGTYDVKAEDSDDNTDKAEFTVGAGVSLSQYAGNVGTTLAVGGVGFTVDGIVTIEYDDTQLAIATAGGNGAFSVTVDVPASIGGNHTITASDGTHIVKCIFVMESEAPPIPELLLPEEATEAEAKTEFDWEAVTDDSLPVTYTLQIATDEDFTADSMVLEKEDLTDSGYTVREEDKLEPRRREEPYYWRVKAKDSASNESQWSAPASFYVGSHFVMPRGAIYALIAVGAGLLAFWLGRRTAYLKG